MTKHSRGLETKLFALIFSVSILVSAAIAVFMYYQQKLALEDQLGEQLLRSARMFAATLDADDVARLPYEPPGSPLAQSYRERAQRIADEAGLAYAYTCTVVEPGVCLFGVTTNDLVAGDTYAFGRLPAASAWASAQSGRAAVSPIYTDEYGEWKTGVVPVRDADGSVVALAGVHVSANFIRSELAAGLRLSVIAGVVLVAVWLLIARVIAVAIIRPVTGALGRFGELVGRVAEGDLAIQPIRARGSDEVARLTRAFNEMVKRLRELIAAVTSSASAVASALEQLHDSTGQVAAVAHGVAHAIEQVAAGATSQSQSTQETIEVVQQLRHALGGVAAGSQQQAEAVRQSAALVSDMVAAVEHVTERSGRVTNSARKAAEAARNGAKVVEQTVRGMARIRHANRETAERIAQLGKVGEQIGSITSTITDIAFETHLLALNASIEAARAGPQGRGFGVVADQVSGLAEKAAASAQEIAELIQSIQTMTDEAVKAMEDGTSEVESGSRLAADAGRALREILAVVTMAANEMETIAAGANEIAVASRGVAEATENIAAVAEQNSASAQQMAGGSDEVRRLMDDVATVAAEHAAASEEVSASVAQLTASAEQIHASAQNLAEVAHELQNQVARFRM